MEPLELRALIKFRKFKKYWEEKGQTLFSDEEVMDYLLKQCGFTVFLYKKQSIDDGSLTIDGKTYNKG